MIGNSPVFCFPPWKEGMAKCQVKEFISETPNGFHETSIKEYLANFAMVRHGNKQTNKTKQKQMHTTERKKETTTVVSLPYSRRSFQKGLPKMYTHVCVVSCCLYSTVIINFYMVLIDSTSQLLYVMP